MSKELIVPVDGRGADWFRRAANAINYLLRERAALLARVEALEASATDHEARIAALETP